MNFMNRKMFATGGSAENPYFYIDATGNTKYLDQAKLVPILRNTDITALEALIQNPDVTYSPATQEVFRQIVGERKATFSSTDPSLFQFGEFLPDNLTGLSALRDIAGFGLDFAGQIGEGAVNLGRSLTSGFGERSVDDPEFAPLDLIPSQRFPNVPDTITGRPGTEEGFMSGFDKSGILRRGYTNPQLASILDRALGEVQDFSNEIDALDDVTTPVVETEDTLDTEIPTSMTDVEPKTFTPDIDAMSEMSTTLGTRFEPGSVGFEREQGRRLAFEQDMIGRDQFGNIIERPDEIQLPPDVKDEIDKTLKEITPIEVLVDTDKTVEQSQAENLIKFDPPEIKLEKVDLTPVPETIPKETTGIFGSDRFLDFIRNVGSELTATGQLGEGLASGAAKAAEERAARELLEEEAARELKKAKELIDYEASITDSYEPMSGKDTLDLNNDLETLYTDFEGGLAATGFTDYAIEIIEEAQRDKKPVGGFKGLLRKMVDKGFAFAGMGRDFEELSADSKVEALTKVVKQKNLQAILGESGRTISDKDRQIIETVFGTLDAFTNVDAVLGTLRESRRGLAQNNAKRKNQIISGAAFLRKQGVDGANFYNNQLPSLQRILGIDPISSQSAIARAKFGGDAITGPIIETTIAT
jgi:hypothetical protein